MTSWAQFSRMGFVLAGGKSSRMGADKAFLEFDGRTLVERAVRVVREVCPKVALVGAAEKFAEYGPVIEDIHPGCGPLGGIHAALASSSSDLNLVLAVDMPFVQADLLAFLMAQAEANNAMVTVPRTRRGFQPLCAVYRRAFAKSAEQALLAGKYKIDAIFAHVKTRVIEESELAEAGFSEHLFSNINTPDDLRAANADVLGR